MQRTGRTNRRSNGVRILVAEDEPLNALGLKSHLEGLGHDVIGPAANGREAVDLAQRESVDLAILDIRMPELSGIEAAEQIFALKPIPILLLTGFSNPDYIAQASALPVYHYLVKPISAEDLGPAISVARARFQEWLTFRSDVDTLQRKLEERRIVERAKMLLMETRGLSETDAYRLLQKESQNRNQPMVEIARTILLAQTVLRDAGGTG